MTIPFRIALLSAAVLCAAPPARAQQQSGVTERLIELLVQRGVLPRDEAAALLKQAQAEGRRAPAPKRAATDPEPGSPAVPPGTVRVTYVPQTVRDQIADQVREQVMGQAKSEGWAQPSVVPDWIQRLKLYGDVRVRYERDSLGDTNFQYFPDFGSINNGSGFNINTAPGVNRPTVPVLNTTQDRDRYRVRARYGIKDDLDDWISSDIRIATGNDGSPVSTNQTFGGNGGNFSKYAIWLDRAYIRAKPLPFLSIDVGRAPNPFWVTDLIYDDDVNFDGISAQAHARFFDERLGLFATGGAFPVFNTDFNLASTTYPQKAGTRNKTLLAVQGGGDLRITDDIGLKLGVGYFRYDNIQGKLSTPCIIRVSSDVCSTDQTRANFIQFGNTLFGIRDFATDPNNPTLAQPQYYGLASKFSILDVHGRLDINSFAPVNIALEGEFAKNLAYDRANILSRNPVNNFGGCPPQNASCDPPYVGGDTAYLLRATVGTPEVARRWDWNVSLTYRYLESDSVLDGLTDSDFHLGGTNAKGYIVGGALGVARNTWVQARWLSADAVSGPPYSADVLQIDLNTRF